MRQDNSSQPALKSDVNWSQSLPGFRLVHTIHLISTVNPDVVTRAAAQLEHACAPVQHWSVLRRGGLLEQKIDLDDISEGQARRLREHLLTLEDVLRVRLEHRFVRRSDESDSTSCASNG